ncbi:MAG: TOBE domain-containing protein, partial [Candidatus Thorarchaeota archaeon]|nr:TOBE domain-containing protein [Candidatus Thorarchaeota archaeon]
NIMQAENLTRRAILIQNGTVQRTGLTSEILRDQLETLVFDDTTRNIFSGSAEFTNGLHSGMRLASIKLTDDVSIDAITDRDGKVTVRIPPEDIVVSLGSVLSSARNTLKGRVSDISLEDAMALLTVDVGVNLVAQITRSSLENLRVALDDEVDVTFKASSVRVY